MPICLAKYLITLVINADEYLNSVRARSVFNAKTKQLLLPSNATRYILFHEQAHFEHSLEIGAEKFIELTRSEAGRLELEEHVFNKIIENSERFRQEELDHAADLITKYRDRAR